MLKISTLCLCLCASMFFASCGDEDSTQAKQENWYKNRPPQKINLQNTGGTGASDNTPQVQAVPFDFGISAALGAGLLAAVRMARKRKGEA
ncbi:MAG: hypothetical protein EON98_08795 [Chitinophagaceae bacterium]|nr:MAG: hypothetical protein EON98_08795 [Chitinophagaceae bacterium]